MVRAPPEGGLFRLPLKLCKKNPKLILGSNKTSQGLCVQVQIILIFTDMFISPNLSSRQCLDCYTSRADQNLPNKDFTTLGPLQLRLSFIRASVASFLIIRSPTSLTFWHWVVVNPHTWSYDFVEIYVFGKQLLGPSHCILFCEEVPLFLKLWGYFVEFLRKSFFVPLGIFYLPTYVDFGYKYPLVEGCSSFSWECAMSYFNTVTPSTQALA